LRRRATDRRSEPVVQARAIPANRSHVVTEAEAVANDRAGLYDLVVYGNVRAEQGNQSVTDWKTPRDRVWLFHGGDSAPRLITVETYSALGQMFVRELA